MAEVKTRICDVCGTSYKVRTYMLNIKRVAEDGDLLDVETQEYCDLCPKHLKRLRRFNARGMKPPTTRENEETKAT